MPHPAAARFTLAALLALGAVAFTLGIDWGLPSPNIDPAWPAQRIIQAGGAWQPDPAQAADAATGPTLSRDLPIHLNQTLAQQARIIRRYRLFSAQPDEMLTFMAIAGMKPSARNFDPRLYQYGGLWIYPVAALLKISHSYGLVTLKPDLNFYLDHPDQFARFYIVARAYSAFWGLIGVAVIFQLARRIFANLITPAAAAACFIFLPVILNGAHEAKPHLAGTVLVLLTILAATRYVQTGQKRDALLAGLFAGMASAMLLTAAVAFIVLPLMAWLRPGRRMKILFASSAIALLIYALTNPYVILHLLRDPNVLQKNLGALTQAKAIVGASTHTGRFFSSLTLLAAGGSSILFIAFAWPLFLKRIRFPRHPLARPMLILLLTPAAIILALFIYLSAGKTGEFARFATLPIVALMLLAIALLSALAPTQFARRCMLTAAIALTAFESRGYFQAYLTDRGGPSAARQLAAQQLDRLYQAGARTLAVQSEPAPYCLPPLDLSRWNIILLPADHQNAQYDVTIHPVDELGTFVTWANKRFDIQPRPGLISQPPP